MWAGKVTKNSGHFKFTPAFTSQQGPLVSLLHKHADSVRAVWAHSLWCISVQLPFNPGYVKILSSFLWPYHLPEFPVKPPDNFPVHFLPEADLQSQVNGATDLLVSLPPRSPTLTDNAPNQVNPSSNGSNKAAGFHHLPFSDWTSSLTETGVWVGMGAPKGTSHTFVLLPEIQ